MNKLVSRNPVQRFKQGRKILFVKPGDKMLYNGNEEVTEEMLNGQTIYRRKNGTYIYPNSKLLSPIKSSTPVDYSFMKGGTRQRTPEEQKKWEAEVQRQKNIQDNIQRKKIITPTKKTVVVNKVLPKYSGVDLQGKTVGEWQKILKDYYAPGTNKKYMEDGIWGDATDAAYRKYLTITNTDFTPISKEPIEIPNNENNNVNFDYEKFKRAALASDYTPDSIEQKLVTTPITYNRSMTRDWLRNNIGTAYGVSGAMRAAARRKLNGQATDNDIALIKSNQKLYDALKNAGLFKKGGQLPSRNVVERFKNGGIQKFQTAGNLPTAPKAEKRFRKNSYNTTKEGNRETTTITSQTFGYNRNWPYFRQPATIQRIIEGGDTAFVETPEHHIFTKVQPRTALKSGNVYVEYNPKYDKNYSLGGQANTVFNYSITPQEYETLKRRFNTAWNLAK